MKAIEIKAGESAYPTVLNQRLLDAAPNELFAIGDLSVLKSRMLGLLCSIQCPGSIVIKTFDTIRSLRDQGIVVAGGFHSPMERECLDILLRGKQQVVWCAARTLDGWSMNGEAKRAVADGRLLVLSPFGRSVRRTTVATAMSRNAFIAALAHSLFVPHASPSGKTWGVIDAAMQRNQPVVTLEDDQNQHLIDLGARLLSLPFVWPPLAVG